MNINSVVFPQKLLISQGQVSLRWFIKTQHLSPPLLSGSAFRHPCDRWTECVIKGATQILGWSKDKNAEGPKGWAVVQPLPSFLGMEPGQLAKEDHTPGKGLLPWLRAGIPIPLSPSLRSQASQSHLETGGMEEKHGTTMAPRLGSHGGVPPSDGGGWWWLSMKSWVPQHMDALLLDTCVIEPDVSSAAVAQGKHFEVKRL